MKWFVSFVFIIFLNLIAVAQVCEGDIYLSSQEEVNLFDNCNIIEGDLSINSSNITDLSPLLSIQEIRGNLSIRNLDNSLTLSGLQNLVEITGYFLLRNTGLENLQGLSNLEYIGGDFAILENQMLTSLEGLSSNINRIEGDLNIRSNPNLENLEGLNNIEYISEDLLIKTNSTLSNINGLNNLLSVENKIEISGNNVLQNIEGLNNLKRVESDFKILNNNSLVSLEGLQNLSFVGGNFSIQDNQSLSDCCGINPIFCGLNFGALLINDNNSNCYNVPAFISYCEDQNQLSIDSVSPHIAVLNESVVFTVYGENLPPNLNLFIEDCTNIEELILESNINERKFICTPTGSIGDKDGYIKKNQDTDTLFFFTVNVLDEGDCIDTYSTIEVSICEGTNFEFGNNTYYSSGIYVDTLQSTIGCDSIVTLTLTVNLCSTVSFDVSGECTNTPVNFINTTEDTQDITSWQWSFGDGFSSNEESPEHTYSSSGNYDVQLIGCSDDICDTITNNIYIKDKLQLSIIELESFPNENNYKVMESGTVHHYFKLENSTNTPVEGIALFYNIIQNSDTIYYGAQSDERGLLDLNITLGGADSTITNDDWVSAGSAIIEFREILIPENSNYCISDWEAIQNDFNYSISMDVGHFESTTDVVGMFGKAGVDAELCGGCLGIGGLGLSALDLGVGLETGLYVEIESKFNESGEHLGYGFSRKSKSKIDFNATLGNVNLPLPLILDDGEIDFASLNIALKPKFHESFFIDKNSENDLLLGLFYLNDLIVSSGLFFQSQVHSTRTALAQYLANVNDNSTFDFGRSFELAFELNVGPELKFKAFGENVDINIKLLNFDYLTGFEVGTDYVNYNQVYSKSHFFRQYSEWDFTGLGANVELFGGSLIYESFYPLMKRGVKYSSYSDFTNNNLLGSEIALYNTTQVNIQGNSRNMEIDGTFKMGEDAINFLNDNPPIINNGVANFLIGKGQSGALLTETTPAILDINNVLNYLRSHYQPNWEKDQLQFITQRNFEKTISGDFEIDFQIALGYGIKFKPSFGVGVFAKRSYPYQTYQYNSDFNEYLASIEYPNDQTFITIPEIGFLTFWDDMKGALGNAAISIYNSVTDWLTDASEYTENGFNWLTNEIRDVIDLQPIDHELIRTSNGLTKSLTTFEDFSTITFGYPEDGSVFSSNTEINLKYYYPQGQIKGLTTDMDTIMIISDLFFFQALAGLDTLETTVQGEFTIINELGLEDLEYLGLAEDRPVSLFYQALEDSVWTQIANVNSTVTFNKLGMFALGTALHLDTISPQVEIILPAQIDTSTVISTFIYDEETGIDWSSLEISLGGFIMPYERVDLTNEIHIPLDSFPFEELNSSLLSVQVSDNSNNYGYDLVTLDIISGVNQIAAYQHLLKVYPNPSNGFINLVYHLEKGGRLTFRFHDIKGNIVYELGENVSSLGIYTKLFDLNHLQSGTYFLSFYLGEVMLETRSIIVY